MTECICDAQIQSTTVVNDPETVQKGKLIVTAHFMFLWTKKLAQSMPLVTWSYARPYQTSQCVIFCVSVIISTKAQENRMEKSWNVYDYFYMRSGILT